ncbi:exodeoxyribonuclease III [Actinotalea sp. M2MS4P-6]|uniref:exodeoxyribonuclease III n=1 Tax=Actinotalea sp. M2MS4P-6 TaxID=2983762 RepID=UPI0021E44F14|nr:exodeoxyribonuclease III [Actinotalea sp. M2MS4P-6]MCV2395430.1 exodeoxyribonuclease III [Actinotalea sp. M2MS4P-6]
MQIASVNVNGIRAAFRRGMADWLAQRQPDVLLLQEVRAPDESVRDHLAGWHVAHAEAHAKGRSGVAVASRLPVSAVRVGLGDEDPSHSGRWIEADLDLPDGVLTVVSVYVHSGTVGHPSMDDKHVFLARVSDRLDELAASGRPAVVGGDLNITHTDADLKNWKGNVGKAGCLPEERAWLTRWFDAGWVDVTRALAGDVSGPYTWWSWRGKAFDNDAGWRIDYQVASPALAPRATAAAVDRAESYDRRFSDHAPLVVEYDL